MASTQMLNSLQMTRHCALLFTISDPANLLNTESELNTEWELNTER